MVKILTFLHAHMHFPDVILHIREVAFRYGPLFGYTSIKITKAIASTILKIQHTSRTSLASLSSIILNCQSRLVDIFSCSNFTECKENGKHGFACDSYWCY